MSNRLLRVRIHAPFLIKLMEEGNISHFMCSNGLAKDCKIERISVVVDGTYQGMNSIDITVSHPELRELANGEIIPVFYPEFVKVE